MNVVFRVDASATIGSGHLVRCLVLANLIASSGGVSYFLIGSKNVVTEQLLHNSMHNVCYLHLSAVHSIWDDLNISVLSMPKQPIDWLIVDQYNLDARWELGSRAYTKALMVIDDLANRPHSCDLLVDPGLGRKPNHYIKLLSETTQTMLGVNYAILKPEFLIHHGVAPLWPTIRRAHVFFGGGSATWLPAHVEAILNSAPTLNVRAVGFANNEAMTRLIEIYGVRLQWNPYIKEMAQEYALCDIAIGSPGTATWERACVGLPSALIATAANQIPILKELDQQAFCRYLGAAWEFNRIEFSNLLKSFLSDQASLIKMRNLGLASVDGKGADRIVKKLFEISLNSSSSR